MIVSRRKYFLIFTYLVLGLTLSQCELEDPNYPIEPSITFKSIAFIEIPGAGTNDSLIFTIKYQDGDRDLGIDSDDPIYAVSPYHWANYFLEDGSGDTTKVSTGVFYDNDLYPYTILNSAGLTGKLVTNRTRNKAGYNYLPPYVMNNCEYYSWNQLLVPETAADASYTILDTLYQPGKRYYIIQEPFLYEENENSRNIFVEFHMSDDGVNFSEFNWKKFCYDYNGRFPMFGDKGVFKSGPFRITARTPWKGEIRYAMQNPSFLTLFDTKKWKLKIKIKDRALHTSNEIETPVFTLDEIRKN